MNLNVLFNQVYCARREKLIKMSNNIYTKYILIRSTVNKIIAQVFNKKSYMFGILKFIKEKNFLFNENKYMQSEVSQ